MKHDLKLFSMEEIQAEEVKWLWYPYLPRGKLTIVQGDPGEGKTTFVLAVIAALTCGEALPETEQALEPINVIYQTAEDGLADTIKPRLEAAGADCSRVLVIDESQQELTLSDERLEQAGFIRLAHSSLYWIRSKRIWETMWTCTGPTKCVPF